MESKYDLAVLIPARNEQFLNLTVKDVLANKRGKTQVLVGLDEEWANPPLDDHPDLTILYVPESIGQRAMTNQLCRMTTAKYVMKLDAHCTVDEGFDVKMMSEMKDDYTMIPALYNLHAFDWVCNKCGNRWYQSPTPTMCYENGEKRTPNASCDSKSFRREIVWKPRLNRRSEFYRFDNTLHFQYDRKRQKKANKEDVLVETMSAQGSCFMLTRKKYWELDICDEKHGSWGQQGTEVACKTWLSGGKLVTNRKTWYSHLFRTQGGDFGFPYPQSGTQTEHAREYSRSLFMNGKWNKTKYNLSWLLNKFWPVEGWTNEDLAKLKKEPTKACIYYTNNKVNIKLGHACRKQILKANLPIVSCSLKPMDFGKNIVLKLESGYLAYHKQILTALENSTADIVYFTEHDVLYHPSHFDFTPPKKDVYYYNTNFWRVRAEDGFAVHYDTAQVNLICAYRELLLQHYREKVRRIEESGFNMKMGFEPGCNNRKERIDNFKAERYQSKYPCLDIRHDTNLTRSRWTKEEFRNERSCRGWKETHLTQIEGWKFNGTTFLDFLKSI